MSVVLAWRCSNIPTVYGENVSAGLFGLRQVQKRSCHVRYQHFVSKKIASKVLGGSQSARLGALLHKLDVKEVSPDPIGVDCVTSDAVPSILNGVLPHERKGGGLGDAVRSEFSARI